VADWIKKQKPSISYTRNSPKVVNNETDLCSLTGFEFKREIEKILKELR